MNDVSTTPCHHFQIRVVLSSLSSLYGELCTEVLLRNVKGANYQVNSFVLIEAD